MGNLIKVKQISGGTSGDVLLTNSGGTSYWGTIPSSGGRFGISNLDGEYTYYTTLQNAINAATTGDTVQVFSNYTETGTTAVILKDGVDINFNGYTYEKTTSDFTRLIEGDGVNCKLINGILVRKNGTSFISCVYIKDSKVDFSNSEIIDINGALNSKVIYLEGDGLIENGKVYQTITGGTSIGINHNLSGDFEVKNFFVESEGWGIDLSNGDKRVYNCEVYTEENVGIRNFNAGTIEKCSIKSNTERAVWLRDGEITDSYCHSISNKALYVDSTTTKRESRVINTTALSEGDYGSFFDRPHSKTIINNLYSRSLVSNGVYFYLYRRTTGSLFNPPWVGYPVDIEAYNIESISDADTSIRIHPLATNVSPLGPPLFKLDNFKSTCLWDDASGHAIELDLNSTSSDFSNYDFYLNNGTCITTSSSGHCLNNVNTIICKYSNLTFQGSSNPINNVNQGLTATTDSYGNININ